MTRHDRTEHSRRGFSLIELLATMTILSIAMAGLVPVVRRVASTSNQATGQTQRLAALSGAVQQIEALPFVALVAGTECQVSETGFAHRTCVSVTESSPTTKLVAVTVTPIGDAASSETATVERSWVSTINPLNHP